MADMMDTLKGLLGEDADNKLDGIMKILNADSTKGEAPTKAPVLSDIQQDASDSPTITPEMIMAAQSLMNKLSASGDDDRTKLLMSLKPYMSGTRKSTIDSAIKMLNLAQMSQFFKGVI